MRRKSKLFPPQKLKNVVASEKYSIWRQFQKKWKRTFPL